MAFEAYLQQEGGRRAGRRTIFALSLVVHALALVAAVAYSFWHVEELSPPRVMVTFIAAAAAPPPPPPPPPLGGGATPARHKAVVRPKVETTPRPEIVQPKDPPKEDPPEAKDKEPPQAPVESAPARAGVPDGVKGGVAGGVKGGVVGGVVGGTGPAAPPPVAAKMLPPHMGTQQKISGADPDFPLHLRRAGTAYLVMAKICVGVAGAVDGVTLLKRADPTLDNNVASTVKTWRFRPLMANGTPVPFCYFGRFEFKSD